MDRTTTTEKLTDIFNGSLVVLCGRLYAVTTGQAAFPHELLCSVEKGHLTKRKGKELDQIKRFYFSPSRRVN
jgi:hypothetical protein